MASADPTMTPLGTDDEAGGAAPPDSAVQADLVREMQVGEIARAEANPSGRERAWFIPLLLGALLLVVLAAAVYGLAR